LDVQAQKLKLIEWTLRTGDPQLLKQLEFISNADQDWWNDLAPGENASIERGLARADAGHLKFMTKS